MLNATAASPREPRTESFAPVSLERAMKDVLSVESAFVAKFLPYQAMTRIPAGFEEFAAWHHRRLGDEAPRWQDAAPAYALACLSHAAYGAAMDPSIEWELELQWADLRRLSPLTWANARPLIMAAWTFLSGHDTLGAALDESIGALADGSPASGETLDADAEDDAARGWLETELVPAYVVLRESMAERDPLAWRTRGQERWLSAHIKAISLALSPALAALEAVTLQGFLDDEPRYLVRLAFPSALMRVAEPPNGDWRERPLRSDLRRPERVRHGDRWALEQRSVLLRVPSALCPGEFNVLANLLHPDFAQLQRVDAMPLNMDRRQRSH